MSRRYVRVQAQHGAWQILDTGADPAKPIAMVYEECVDPGFHQACAGVATNVTHLLELLNRDHEMRVAVDRATNRGPAA